MIHHELRRDRHAVRFQLVMQRPSGLQAVLGGRLRIGAAITVVADAASVGSDAGSIATMGQLLLRRSLMGSKRKSIRVFMPSA